VTIAPPCPTRPTTLASLRIKQFRIFWLGYLVSNVGTWMGWVAQDWLVFSTLTSHSALAMGLATASQIAPIVLLAPWTGALADRWPERRVLMVTSTVLLASSLLLAALVVTGRASLPVVLLVGLVQGIASACEGPARQAVVTDLVAPPLLTNAVGLNSLAFNVGRLLGPAAAGMLIAWQGVELALLANALSFGVLVLTVARMRVEHALKSRAAGGLSGLAQAARWVRADPALSRALLVACVLAAFGLNLPLINALMVARQFDQSPRLYGLLGSAIAVGTLGAAVVTARQAWPRLGVSLAGLAGFAVMAAAAALAPTAALYAVCVAGMGLGAVVAILVANSLVRISATGPSRGRVMALYLACTNAALLLGSLLLGRLGDLLGPRWVLGLASLCTGALALTLAARPTQRASVGGV
jgi:MFS family permease